MRNTLSSDVMDADMPSDSEDVAGLSSSRAGLGQEAATGAEAGPSSLRTSHKRPHSPATGSTSNAPSPAAPLDPSEVGLVAPLPMLVPPTGVLPPSDFTFYATRYHPVTRNGYRYTTCGPSPTCQLAVPIQRTVENVPQCARLSWEDRSAFALITEDAHTITAEKGWRAARANVGLREGNWYWEIKAHRCGGEGSRANGGSGEGSWMRVGVGRREAQLNAPCGFDGYSYAYRDRNGEAVTLSRPQDYGKAYKSGSTIGVYISLPPRAPPVDRRDPARIVRKRLPIRYKGQLYFELLEYAPTKEMAELVVDPATRAKEVIEMKKKVAPGQRAPPPSDDSDPPLRPLPTLDKAKIAFFVDGECQGVAYENIYDFLPLRLHANGREKLERKKADPRTNWHDDGTMGYYPHVSVFGGAIASMNAGPDFDFPPPDDIEAALKVSPRPPQTGPIVDKKAKQQSAGKRTWRPLCDRYAEAVAEGSQLDDVDEEAAVRAFAEQAQQPAQYRAPRPASGVDYDSIPPVTKRQRRMEDLGVVKREDVASPQGLTPKAEDQMPESRGESVELGVGLSGGEEFA